MDRRCADGLFRRNGCPPDAVARTVALEPVMSYRAPVIFSKDVRAGDTISYKRIYEVPENTTVATTSEDARINATSTGR